MAEHGWAMFHTEWKRLLSPRRLARIATMTEHNPVDALPRVRRTIVGIAVACLASAQPKCGRFWAYLHSANSRAVNHRLVGSIAVS